MHFTTLTTLLTLATTALSAPTFLSERGSQNHGTFTYCSAPNICAGMAVTGNCQTLDRGYSLLEFSPDLSCSIYAQGSCEKAFNTRKGKVAHVSGKIDTHTDPRAQKYGVGAVQSFRC